MTLLSLVGRAQTGLLREGLLSLVSSWRAIPSLRIISDGTLGTSELSRSLEWYPGEFIVEQREAIVRRAAAEGGRELSTFAAASLFGAKFAAAVLAARSGAVLLADSDILWFRDFTEELRALARIGESLVLRTSRDYQKSYDPDLETLFDRYGASVRAPFVNAGLVYLHGDLLGAIDLVPALRLAGTGNRYFGEQTLWALAASVMNVQPWPAETIACTQADHQRISVTYRGSSWIARHYVGSVRHLFWRDALALRLGVRQ